MTMLEELKKLERQAPEAPWGITCLINPSEYVVNGASGKPPYLFRSGTGDATALVVAMRNALPTLIKCVESADNLASMTGDVPTWYINRVAKYRQDRANLDSSSMTVKSSGHYFFPSKGVLVCMNADGRGLTVDEPDKWSFCPYCGLSIVVKPEAI